MTEPSVPKGFKADPFNPNFCIRETDTAIKLRELEERIGKMEQSAALKATQEAAEIIRANMQEEINHLRAENERLQKEVDRLTGLVRERRLTPR